jgi:hypothetical protein
MRHTLVPLLLVSFLAACKTTGSECRRYVREQNACARELGQAATFTALTADVTCAALNLPGIANEDLRDSFSCLADAWASADCSTEEAYLASFDTTCDVDDTDDTD